MYSLHIDQIIAGVVIVALISVTVTLALSYDKGFIQWFKDHL